ncbi:unnamed protein product [Albugo candida]|uniref:Transmembrane protein 267 n=2 Tax=Albugo candida TaxID=65357 RepID=A0A024GKZ5_9STRA|nr:unnamed protein product [Albugo candida]|eukprot:CCI47006.1 unnamed protein product [Albugo candida]
MGIWRVIVPGALVFSCVSVDLLLEIVSKRTISGHIVDNLGHGMIAFVSYAVFTLWQKPQSTWKRAWIHSFVAGICSCAMDLDHFIAAGSFRIDAATNLKKRPFAHAFAFIALMCVFVWIQSAGNTKVVRFQRVALLWIALSSHQLRDAVRHGVWLWPFGSTPPIPYALYLFIQVLLPLSIARAQAYLHLFDSKVEKALII